MTHKNKIFSNVVNIPITITDYSFVSVDPQKYSFLTNQFKKVELLSRFHQSFLAPQEFHKFSLRFHKFS